jgi:hypothetical protein
VLRKFDGSIRPDQRLVELARILAAGISRLHVAQRRAESATSGTSCHFPAESPGISTNLPATPLERSHATGVTVTTAVNCGESGVLETGLAAYLQELTTWL